MKLAAVVNRRCDADLAGVMSDVPGTAGLSPALEGFARQGHIILVPISARRADAENGACRPQAIERRRHLFGYDHLSASNWATRRRTSPSRAAMSLRSAYSAAAAKRCV